MSDIPQLTVLASGYTKLEGPTLLDQDVYFSDLVGGVHGISLEPQSQGDRVPTGWATDRLMIGGLTRHLDGGFLVGGSGLGRLLPDGSVSEVLTLDQIGPKNGIMPFSINDIEADASGAVYAGVLRKDEDGNFHPGDLIRVTGPGDFSFVTDDIYPNGMAFSPDGSLMYAADTFRRELVVFDVAGANPSHQIVRRIPLDSCTGYPDGLVVDSEGFIWIAFFANGDVVRFAPSGEIDRVLTMDGYNPLSLCFRGPTGPTELVIVTGVLPELPDSDGSVLTVDVGVTAGPVYSATI